MGTILVTDLGGVLSLWRIAPLQVGRAVRIFFLSPYIIRIVTCTVPQVREFRFRRRPPLRELCLRGGRSRIRKTQCVTSEFVSFISADLTGTIGTAFEEYSVQTELKRFIKIKNEHNLPWTTFVGAAGMPGKSFFSFLESSTSNMDHHSGRSDGLLCMERIC